MNDLEEDVPYMTQSYCYKSGYYTDNEMVPQKSHHTHLHRAEYKRIKYKWKVLPGPPQKFTGSQT